MSGRWYLYHFDYSKYLEARPALRIARSPDTFARLAYSEEAREILREYRDKEISLEAARHALAKEHCCRDEPLVLGVELPRLAQRLCKWRGGEEASELLSELLTGGKNLDECLLPPIQIYGFLTPAQTIALSESLARAANERHHRRLRRRKGGLMGITRTFLRNLFDAPLPQEEVHRLLHLFTEDAAERNYGIAVLIA